MWSEGARVLGAVGLRQQAPHRRQRHGADRGEDQEDRAPAERDQDIAADQRRQQRRGAHHQQHARQHLDRGGGIEQVAHHGARRHHAGAGAQRLEQSQAGERADRRCQGAAERGDGEQHQTGIERRLAAEAVGQRSEESLPRGEAEEERRQGALGRRSAGGEVVRQRGQRRQVHVDRERRERGQRRQQDDQLDAARAGGLRKRQGVFRRGVSGRSSTLPLAEGSHAS